LRWLSPERRGTAADAVAALELVPGVARNAGVVSPRPRPILCDYDGFDLIVIEAMAAPEALLDVVLARADTVARERLARGDRDVSCPNRSMLRRRSCWGRGRRLLCNPSEPGSGRARCRSLARGRGADADDAPRRRIGRLRG
jgi:hypothetical protein